MSFTNKSHTKSLPCRECGEVVKNLSSEATAVTCWRCVNKALSGGPIHFDNEEVPAPKEKEE